MNLALFSFLLTALALLISAEVLDYGDLKQYSLRQDVEAPPLTGNTVWLSGKENDGYNVYLSPETQDKVVGILEACGKADDKCYQEVRKVLRSANLQIDGEIERRGFVQFLSKTFKKVGSVFSFIAGALISNWAMKQEQPSGLFVPHEIASQASKLTEATGVVVSADGTVVATITPTPDPTKLQGSQTPSVTPVTESKGDYAEGDLIAVLDESLASRIDEVMHRSQNCDDGQTFDRGDKNKRKRAGASFGKAICAAEAAAVMSQRGGPFNDLLLINPAHLSFDFAEAAGAVAQAANVASDFVRAYAPMLDISPDLAEQLGNLLFALAVNTLMENRPLGKSNRIEASKIETETPTATPTGCPNPDSTPGKYKSCECNTPSDTIENIASNEEQKSMLNIAELFRHTGTPNSPSCKRDDLSDIPSNIFYSTENNVFHRFCEKWDAGTKLQMTVNAEGEDTKPSFELVHSVLQERTPPPDPSNWSKYDFHLSFIPAKEKKKCVVECKKAYAQLATACQNTGSAGNLMASSGKVDVNCGTFDYSIEKKVVHSPKEPPETPKPPPKTPLKVFPRFCFGADDFGKHGDIQPSLVREYSFHTCSRSRELLIKRDDKSTFRWWATTTNKVPYQFNIYWKHGCVSEGPDEVYSADPLSTGELNWETCYHTVWDNFRKCNNGGVGGNIQIGCLVYEFKAQKVQNK
ncbi:hypothetical protein ACHAQA_003586 [Verticillium albo-atrum]